MLHKLAFGVAAAALLIGPLAASAAETVTVTADHDYVCKAVAQPGSRIARQRVCMTKDQWEAVARRARENLVHSQDSALFVNSVMAKPGG